MADPDTVNLGAIRALLREEWPVLDDEALDATGGDREQLVALIAERTEHSRALVRRQLAELEQLSTKSRAARAGLEQLERLEAAVRKLEGEASEVVNRVKKELVPQAESRVKENLLSSLLGALLVGLVLGLIMGGRRGR